MKPENVEIVNWLCATLVGAMLLTRLYVCHLRKPRRIDCTAAIVVLSVVVMLGRCISTHLYLVYGAASTYDSSQTPPSVPPSIKIGSILVLLARLLISTFYWLQSAILLLFYTRMFSHFDGLRRTIHVCWAIIGGTYIAVIGTGLLECRPFYLYWQVLPHKDDCLHASINLMVQCVGNVIIDAVLLIISSPLLVGLDRTIMQKVRLGLLYLLGSFCIIINILRVMKPFNNYDSLFVRSSWASVQAIVTAFIANAPSVYGAFMLCRRQARHKSDTRQSNHRQTSMSRNDISGHSGDVVATASPAIVEDDV